MRVLEKLLNQGVQQEGIIIILALIHLICLVLIQIEARDMPLEVFLQRRDLVQMEIDRIMKETRVTIAQYKLDRCALKSKY